MFKNNKQYNKVYRNGILYDKAFRNGQQILGNPSPVDSSLLLNIPFNGDFENKVAGGIQIVVAGGAPTFANGAAAFSGTQSVKTAAPLNIGTDKVTVCLWLKPTSASTQNIFELSENANNNNAFYSFYSNFEPLRVDINDRNINASYSSLDVFLNQETFICFTIDRNSSTQKVYVNGNLATTVERTGAVSGIFGQYVFYIGQRAGNEYGFNGEIRKFQLYNRVLSDTEIFSKFNQGH